MPKGGTQFLLRQLKKVVNYFENKVHPCSFCGPPM